MQKPFLGKQSDISVRHLFVSPLRSPARACHRPASTAPGAATPGRPGSRTRAGPTGRRCGETTGGSGGEAWRAIKRMKFLWHWLRLVDPGSEGPPSFFKGIKNWCKLGNWNSYPYLDVGSGTSQATHYYTGLREHLSDNYSTRRSRSHLSPVLLVSDLGPDTCSGRCDNYDAFSLQSSWISSVLFFFVDFLCDCFRHSFFVCFPGLRGGRRNFPASGKREMRNIGAHRKKLYWSFN